MTRQIIHMTIKIIITAVIASSLAYIIGINDYILVGILGILSVSLTKQETIKNGLKRYINVLYALFLGTILFGFLGFNLLIFLLFLVIFIFTSYLLKIDIGLVPAIVLVNHVYNFGSIDKTFLLQEFGIITVAVLVAIVINVLYPSFWETLAKDKLKEVDLLIKKYLEELAKSLKSKTKKKNEKEYQIINDDIHEKIIFIEKNEENKLFLNDYRYLAYIYMRKSQLTSLNNIYGAYLSIVKYHKNQELIGKYIESLKDDIGDINLANKQLEILSGLREQFKKEELPQSRDEFETRALLYYIIQELENFLMVKKSFHLKYTQFEL